MSTKLTGYVWDGCAASGMKLSSVAIMARLADFSNDEGVCWPSIETIARQIGAGMSTVRTAIGRLEAEGWLHTLFGGGSGSVKQRLRCHRPESLHD
ncbi:helix-turn-helix domain-containing protein [Escherichia coli]